MTPLPARFLLLCLLTCSTTVFAQQAGALEGKRLAVLEFTNASEKKLASLGTLSDEARGAVLDAAGIHGAVVLTRENMLEVLKATGGSCKEGECEVETARNLGVYAFVSGTVSFVDDAYLLTLKVYDTRTGSLLGQQLVQASKELELVAQVRTATGALVQKALGLAARARPRESTGVVGQVNAAGGFELQDEETVIAAFESTPPGAVVMLDGKLLCQSTPCSRPVSPGVHVVNMSLEEYDEARGSITLGTTQKKVSLRLSPAFATLSVKTVPEGLGLMLDGQPLEQAQAQGRRLSPGNHELLIRDACHEPTGERFTVGKGEAKSVVLTAAQRMAGLKVEAVDGQNNAVEGEVWAGETVLGAAWKALKVPLCAERLHVRTESGARSSVEVRLVEKQVMTVQVLAGLPPEDFIRMLSTDLGVVYLGVPPVEDRRRRYQKECSAGEVVACALQKAPRLPLTSWEGLDGAGLLKACLAGQFASCAPATWVLGTRSPQAGFTQDATDLNGAYRAAAHGCNAGLLFACARQAGLLQGGWGTKPDLDKAVSLARKGCEGATIHDCQRLGGMYLSGTGMQKDEARAAELFSQGCKGGQSQSCISLARMREYGRGIPRDVASAVALYKQSCDGGDAEGCAALGVMYMHGKGVAKDDSRALELLRSACAAGDTGGCIHVGWMHENGRGAPKDEARAVSFYRQACDAGDAHGCKNLGIMFENGKGAPKDEVRAVALYKQACDGGYAEGCRALGNMYVYGKGVAKDDSRALELLRTACTAGDTGGCVYVGWMHENGRGTPKDEARAVTFYEQACDTGDNHGCRNLGTMYENGRGVSKDEVRAAAFYKQACDGGHAGGCRALGNMYVYGK
ncbi:MAG: hypothetical protein RL653_1155, partial [Pseudomonadota bacterium]